MTPAAVARAVEILAAARGGTLPLTGLPEECRPADEAAAYAVQEALHRRFAESGRGRVVGYKIGCTTPVMQAYMGIDHPCAGGIIEGTVHHGSAEPGHGDFRRVGVECEIAVGMAAALPAAAAPFDRDAVAAAVGACMAAIEIVEDRFTELLSVGMPTLIADDFCGAGCVLGRPPEDWRDLDLAAVGAAMSVNGREVGRGTGAQVLGHPLQALVWLANALAARGHGLVAGDVVLTGSIVEVQWVAAGDEVSVAMEGLGEAHVRFA